MQRIHQCLSPLRWSFRSPLSPRLPVHRRSAVLGVRFAASAKKSESSLSSIFERNELKISELEREAPKLLAQLKDRLQRLNVFQRHSELEAITNSPTFWNDQRKANEIMKEHSQLKRLVTNVSSCEYNIKEYGQLIEFANEEPEFKDEAESILQRTWQLLQDLDFQTLMRNHEDEDGCFLEVQSGAGGTESMDWAQMLLTMYIKWAQRKGFDTEMIDKSDGEVAGVKSATIKIGGNSTYSYGWLRSESGIHRLIRLSPFDANNRRHTSFASVFVFPATESSDEVEIDKKDLKIETFRASGPGGQHVNRTESAVRITHIPTGISAQSQNDRSQARNKESAMKVLQSRLKEMERKRQAEQLQSSKAEIGENSWGNQIRTYTLHPYQMVKDSRFAVETTHASDVLDGGVSLDSFLIAAMRNRI